MFAPEQGQCALVHLNRTQRRKDAVGSPCVKTNSVLSAKAPIIPSEAQASEGRGRWFESNRVRHFLFRFSSVSRTGILVQVNHHGRAGAMPSKK